MLGPFNAPPFICCCQTNPLLTCPKQDSTGRWVIMDLSWPLLPDLSINGGTARESFLGSYQKMHLPSAHDMSDIIHKAGRGVSYTLLT